MSHKFNKGVFASWGGKTNRVSSRHAGRAVRGAILGMVARSGSKNDKRGGSIKVGL